MSLAASSTLPRSAIAPATIPNSAASRCISSVWCGNGCAPAASRSTSAAARPFTPRTATNTPSSRSAATPSAPAGQAPPRSSTRRITSPSMPFGRQGLRRSAQPMLRVPRQHLAYGLDQPILRHRELGLRLPAQVLLALLRQPGQLGADDQVLDLHFALLL